MIDLLFICLNILISVMGSYISINIKNNLFPYYLAPLSGILLAILWLFEVKYSNIPMFQLSCIINVVITVGYFMGFAIFTQNINTSQWIGMAFLTIGIFLINK